MSPFLRLVRYFRQQKEEKERLSFPNRPRVVTTIQTFDDNRGLPGRPSNITDPQHKWVDELVASERRRQQREQDEKYADDIRRRRAREQSLSWEPCGRGDGDGDRT